jgi:hypothetical protein
MNAAAALEVPTGIRLTPPSNRDPLRSANAQRTLATLSALPPCTDAEAAMPEVCLLLTEAEIEIIESKSQALADAQADLTRADQTLAAAETLARRVPALQAAAGRAAAAGFSGRAVDAEAAQRASAELAEAERAASAVRHLTEAQREAKDAASRALGSLRVNSQSAVRNALIRAGREYERLAREQVRVVGHMLAAVETLNDRELMTDLHTMFIPVLSVPAPPSALTSDHAAVETLNFRRALIAPQHPRLAAHAAAARGRLVGQLQDAAGLSPSRLMLG